VTRAAPAVIEAPIYTPRMRKKPRPRRMRLRIDPEGRVRIPSPVLRRMKLKAGDVVSVEASRDGIRIYPPAPPGLLWDRGLLVIAGPPLEDVLDAVARCKREDLEREIRRSVPS
jgi:bifunctional DNA-binding transcriptional regulator/antitoxin component of YhaV-PrlF toxin-antitoxin module